MVVVELKLWCCWVLMTMIDDSCINIDDGGDILFLFKK